MALYYQCLFFEIAAKTDIDAQIVFEENRHLSAARLSLQEESWEAAAESAQAAQEAQRELDEALVLIPERGAMWSR